MRQKLLNYALIFALVYGTTPYSFAGGVVADNFTGIDLTDDTNVMLTDPDLSGALDTFEIVEALGQRSGSNLFHSFLQFVIDPGEIAVFSETVADSTTNVISRVTGPTNFPFDPLNPL